MRLLYRQNVSDTSQDEEVALTNVVYQTSQDIVKYHSKMVDILQVLLGLIIADNSHMQGG